MRPDYTRNDLLNVVDPDSELPGNVSLPDPFARHLSNLQHLLFVQFRAWIRRPTKSDVWVSLATIRGVIKVRTEPEVSDVTAWRIVAPVKDREIASDLSVRQYPSQAMCFVRLPVEVKRPVSLLVGSALPRPALVGVTNLNLVPKVGLAIPGGVLLGVVSRKIPLGVTCKQTLSGTGSVGNPGCLSASAQTKPAWIGRNGPLTTPLVVVVDESLRLPLDPSVGLYSLGGNRGKLAATTVAVAVWDFIKGKLGLGKAWGMLRHVNVSFVDLTKPGLYQQRPALSIGRFTPSIIPHLEGNG